MKKILIIAVGLAVAAFLYWTISPLFITKEVNDELDPEILRMIESEELETQEENPDFPVEEVPSTDSAVNEIVETSTPTEAPRTTTEGPFPIVDTRTHPASGDVRLIRTPEETIVRYENYEGTNGPDLYVYLAKDLDAEEFVDLGRAKGNKGNINYSVPDDIDIDEYQYVMTWCRAFGVLFDYALINP